MRVVVAGQPRALEAHPDLAQARYHRAAYLARLGRPAEAGPDLRRALERSNNEDLAMLYQNLMKGSRNHLRAFARNLASRTNCSSRRSAQWIPAIVPVTSLVVLV